MKSSMKYTNAGVIGIVLIASVFAPTAQAKVANVDRAMADLLGHPAKILNLFQAENKGLDYASAKHRPWSGSYWPDIMGGITNHYRQHVWGSIFESPGAHINFALKYNASKRRFQNDHAEVCEDYSNWDFDTLNYKLSPTEKYDLLIGNTDFAFTENIMEEMDFRNDHGIAIKKRGSSADEVNTDEGNDNNFQYTDVTDEKGNSVYQKYDNQIEYRYWNRSGVNIAYWSGICDGWAPASVYLPRPSKPVTVMAKTGQLITFYPDDLKALGSYLFARTNTAYFTSMNYHYAGRQCTDMHSVPKQDAQGFIEDVRCNDLDPAIWHLSLVNRIGLDGRGFAVELDNNHMVNNHPVSSYELTYFNLTNGEEGTARDSIVEIDQVKDGYAKRRNPKAKYLVGVKSKITFLYYVWPENNRKEDYDDESRDKTRTRTYVYDLELDANGNILSGEWGDRYRELQDALDNQNASSSDDLQSIELGPLPYADQPDFIWMSAPNALAYSENAEYTRTEMLNSLAGGTAINPANPRPFGNMKWEWDGKGPMPDMWVRAAKLDAQLHLPTPGERDGDDVSPREAKNSVLKSPQPLSTIIYYLFDKARMPGDK